MITKHYLKDNLITIKINTIMLCEKYTQLTPLERAIYIGELVHAVQSDEKLFGMGEDIIQLAILQGHFDGVKIMPDSTPESETN